VCPARPAAERRLEHLILLNLMESSPMKVLLGLLAAASTLLSAGAALAEGVANKAPLRLVSKIALPGIDGDFDHFTADVKGNRLFLAAEEHHTVEVFDLHSGKKLHSIAGFDTPHSMLYVPDANKLFVVDGGKGGSVQVLNATTYAPQKSIKLSEDADALVYDSAAHILYVGNGGKEAGNDYSFVTAIDTNKDEKVGEIKVPSANLEAMALQKQGSLLYVNMRDKNQIGVIDRKTNAIVATWQLSKVLHNTPMVLDEPDHRLLIAGRKPGVFGVVSTDSGKEITALPAADGVDDMSFDPSTKMLYLACADGVVSVFRQIDADHYESAGSVPSGYRGKIGLLVPELRRYYVVSSKKGAVPAQLFIFDVVN
jgi:DNA-binding beta-propeller fold protein YncE